MSNPFEPPTGPPPEKGAAPATQFSSPFDPPSSPPPAKASSSSTIASPPDIPSNRPGASGSSSNPAAAVPDTDVSIPDEPPPAYSSAPGVHTSVQSGPSRMDFSGPPPIPDRFQIQNQHTGYDRPQIEQQITGVGYGYRPDPTPGPMYTQYTGFAPSPTSPPSKQFGAGDGNGKSQEKPISSQPTGYSSAGPSRPPPPIDLSPTEVATPGRPLLRKGQLLVYPKNHYCQKCGNTGYKKNDPNNPHDTDWKKYGKPYNSALQISYKQSTDPMSNGATQSASNFQKPLPDFSRPPQGGLGPGPGQGYNGGEWNQHPGNYAPRPPPPGQGWAPPPQQWAPPPPPPQIIHHNPYMGGPRLPGGLVVKPGDPRIGGRPCWKCGSEGRALSFFGFDDGPCRECRGIGRLFI